MACKALKHIVFFIIIAFVLIGGNCWGQAGMLDSTFGADGVSSTSLLGGASSLVIQPDGKIVVSSISKAGYFAVLRFNPNGGVDSTFGKNGEDTEIVGVNYGGNEQCNSIALTPHGKIVVGGNDDYDGFAIARFNSNGIPDSSFNGNGQVYIELTYPYESDGSTIAVQSDGKILECGFAQNASGFDFAVLRFDTAGMLDNSFGDSGVVLATAGTPFSQALAIAVQPDGKVLVCGTCFINGSNPFEFALARFNSDGTPDNTFGTNGAVDTRIDTIPNEVDLADCIALQTDGKILLGGYSYNDSTNYDFALARYNSNGTLDSSFGSDGKVTTDFNDLYDQAQGITIQSDGKIILVGYSIISEPLSEFCIDIARYNTNGTLDSSFGLDGKVITNIDNDDDASGVSIQQSGKIIVSGATYSGLSVLRYLRGHYQKP